MSSKTESPFTILIVDDVPKNIQVAANILQESGYQMAFAQDGPTAIDQIETNRFDLILLDIMMPGMDGYQVCQKIKANPSNQAIPVIFLTAKDDTDSIVKGFELGAVDYLTKPFNGLELQARVKTHLELYRSKKEIVETNQRLNLEIGERIKVEKKVEKISDEMRAIQDKIQALMIESKGQPKPMKLLNIQKIKALRLESNTKAQEARTYLKQMQLLLLVEAMHEHHKEKAESKFIEKVLDSDVDALADTLFDEDVKKAIEEGKIDDVKGKLKDTFAKEEIPTDNETDEMLGAIEDLEKADEDTAIRLAGEKARQIAETPVKKKNVVSE